MITGPIADAAKAQLPITWSALLNDPRFGEGLLQGRVDLTKYKTFGVVAPPEQESILYDPLVIEYVGKSAAMTVIPAGIDYWSEQPTSTTSTGTNEQETYPNRVDALWKLYEKLLTETRMMLPDIEGIIDLKVRRKTGAPMISDSDSPFITSDPFHPEQGFPREFADPDKQV